MLNCRRRRPSVGVSLVSSLERRSLLLIRLPAALYLTTVSVPSYLNVISAAMAPITLMPQQVALSPRSFALPALISALPSQ